MLELVDGPSSPVSYVFQALANQMFLECRARGQEMEAIALSCCCPEATSIERQNRAGSA